MNRVSINSRAIFADSHKLIDAPPNTNVEESIV
jgi:hypothetical protein